MTDQPEVDAPGTTHEAERAGSEVPPRPNNVPANQKWFTLTVSGRYRLCYSEGRGQDRYFISKGSRSVVESFPFTDDGWIEAWRHFEALEPNTAKSYAATELARAKESLHGVRSVWLGDRAVYMGGLPELRHQVTGSLFLTEDQMGVGGTGPQQAVVRLADIANVEISDGTVSKSKVAATLAFGVLGATGSRGTRTEVSVVANLKDGSSVYYLLPDSKEGRLTIRAKAGPILQAAGIPFADDVLAAPAASSDIADQLQKLIVMRDEGLLNEEEFAKAKAKLLG